MSTEPDGIPPRTRREARARAATAQGLPRGVVRREQTRLGAFAQAFRPWRRRVAWLGLMWAGVSVFTAALGLTPDVPVILAILVAAALLLWHVVDHTAPQHLTSWPLVDGDLAGQGRGNDFRVTNLAGRLEAANTRGEGRESVVHDLHLQLQVLIRERLHDKHGIVAEEEPRWAQSVTPSDLWDLLVGLPPADLYRPQRLDPILRRIEQW